MNPIHPALHGIFVYFVVADFSRPPNIVAPSGLPAGIFYALAAILLLVTLATPVSLSAFKAVFPRVQKKENLKLWLNFPRSPGFKGLSQTG
jgi:hypothetical protein